MPKLIFFLYDYTDFIDKSINQSIYLSTLLVHNIRGNVRIIDIQMQVGLNDLKMLTGHQEGINPH